MKHQWTSEERRVLSQLGELSDSHLAKVVKAVFGWECSPSQVRSFLSNQGVSRSTRKPKTAKAAGKRFEREVADYLAERLEDDRIDRMPLYGSRDRGDIAGVRLHGQRYVIECKNTQGVDLNGWISQAETEAGNDDAAFCCVIHKRRNHGVSGAYVTMTLDQLLKQVWQA